MSKDRSTLLKVTKTMSYMSCLKSVRQSVHVYLVEVNQFQGTLLMKMKLIFSLLFTLVIVCFFMFLVCNKYLFKVYSSCYNSVSFDYLTQ